MAEELHRRLEELRNDFAEQTGHRFEHFYCPILRRDEPSPLCRGHIVPDAFDTCGKWLPQRQDVDNFYGSVAEADFVRVVEDRGKRLPDLWLDPTLRKRHRPKIQFHGKPLGHYFPEMVSSRSGQVPVEVVDDRTGTIHNVALRITLDEARSLDGKDVQLVVDRDYRPAVIASVLKAAHLTLFGMLGYRYVFSPPGIYLADILAAFFLEENNRARTEVLNALARYFLPLARMAAAMPVASETYRGTVFDNRLIGCVGASGRIFATGVIVPAAGDMFCVFLPTYGSVEVETYFGFLNEPPPSIAVRLMELSPPDDTCAVEYWKVSGGEPGRISLRATLPD
jgi:hypothetical protein